MRPEAVRQARLEAGLSLAQVAGGEVSRNAIHLVESGRARPSIATLRLIAQRTGRPVEFFLASAPDAAAEAWAADNLQLIELESRLARAELAAALELGERLLEQVGEGPLAATVRLRLAEANCRLRRPEAALEHLSGARIALEATGDDWAAIEALDWEAAARFLLEDPGAVDLLEEARRRCLALAVPAPRLLARIETHLATVHVHRHSWRSAVRAFEAAITAGSDIFDLLELAHAHSGLGTAYQHLGQPAKALVHASKALALYELRAEVGMRANAHNNIGDLLLHEGQFDAAERHIREAVAAYSELNAERQGLGYALTSLAELEVRRGNGLAALEAALEAIEAAREAGERVVIGMAHIQLGAAHELLGRGRDADGAFDQALAVLAAVDQPLRLRDAHMRVAEILEARGRVDQAAAHWRAAAELGRDHGTGVAQAAGWLGAAAAG